MIIWSSLSLIEREKQRNSNVKNHKQSSLDQNSTKSGIVQPNRHWKTLWGQSCISLSNLINIHHSRPDLMGPITQMRSWQPDGVIVTLGYLYRASINYCYWIDWFMNCKFLPPLERSPYYLKIQLFLLFFHHRCSVACVVDESMSEDGTLWYSRLRRKDWSTLREILERRHRR